MARGKIVVETSDLVSTAGKIEGWAEQYRAEYTKLYNTIRALKSAWDGSDNLAYTDQIEGFRDDFQRMEKLMRQYADYLRKAAQTYRTTQENVASKARTLSRGN